MIDTGTLCLLSLAAVFYLALPIWGGVHASRVGRPGWAALAILSIFIGLGPIGGILALTVCKEPLMKVTPRTLEIDEIRYFIERVVFRKSVGSRRGGNSLVVLFSAANAGAEGRIVATENWRLEIDESEYAPEWSLSTAAVQAFPGRTYHASLEPGKKLDMLAAFQIPEESIPRQTQSETRLFIAIPNQKDSVEERIEVKI